jgi:hypothetical protein
MLRGHPRRTDVTGVVHFREKTHVAPLAGVVNAQSPPELCGLWGEPYGLPWLLNIFRRGGRGEAAGRNNEAQTVHPELVRGQRCSHRAFLLNGPLDQDPRRPPRFSAFSLSFCAGSQAIAVAFRLPVTPNPPFRSQSRSEASRRAAPPPVSGRQ